MPPHLALLSFYNNSVNGSCDSHFTDEKTKKFPLQKISLFESVWMGVRRPWSLNSDSKPLHFFTYSQVTGGLLFMYSAQEATVVFWDPDILGHSQISRPFEWSEPLDLELEGVSLSFVPDCACSGSQAVVSIDFCSSCVRSSWRL